MSSLATIIIVEDIARSRTLYEGILGQKVVADFGIYNVGFEGGFAMYRRSFFQELTGRESVLDKSNSFVLYLEVDKIEELENVIRENRFEFLHETREQPWKQRILRFYDYDNHIVEIAEKMDAVSRRLFDENHSIEEISKMTGLPIEEVQKQIALRRDCSPGGECP